MASGSSLSFFSVSLDTAAKQLAIPISKILLHEHAMPIFDITHERPAVLKTQACIHRPGWRKCFHRSGLKTQPFVGTLLRLGKNHLLDADPTTLAQWLRRCAI